MDCTCSLAAICPSGAAYGSATVSHHLAGRILVLDGCAALDPLAVLGRRLRLAGAVDLPRILHPCLRRADARGGPPAGHLDDCRRADCLDGTRAGEGTSVERLYDGQPWPHAVSLARVRSSGGHRQRLWHRRARDSRRRLPGAHDSLGRPPLVVLAAGSARRDVRRDAHLWASPHGRARRPKCTKRPRRADPGLDRHLDEDEPRRCSGDFQ